MTIASEEQARKGLMNMMSKHNAKLITFVAQVLEVRESEGVCDVKPTDGNPEFYDVRLVPSIDNVVDGVVAIPLVGSFVICGRLQNENDVFLLVPGEITKYIIKCSDGGKIELNGDGFSLVKGETLQAQVNKMKEDFNAFILKYNAHVHAETGATTAVPVPLGDPTAADFSNILNNEVKHGQS